MPEEPSPTTDRLTGDHPTRRADHNQNPARADPTTENLLPSLDDGITLLDVESDRDTPIVQSLVLDHLLLQDGPAFWVDADGHATTTTLARIAPSQRLLDRIQVARGFTAYQHYGAICNLPIAADQYAQQPIAGVPRRQPSGRDQASSPHTPSLIVVPAIDVQYRADDTLGERPAETLQARTLARLATYADGYDVPVLVTRSTVDEFTAPVATAAHHHLECEQTRLGPRFVGDEFETLAYPVGDGAYYQTTLAYWQQLLAARAKQLGLEPATPSSTPASTVGVGGGATTDGETRRRTVNPLLDALATDSAGGR